MRTSFEFKFTVETNRSEIRTYLQAHDDYAVLRTAANTKRAIVIIEELFVDRDLINEFWEHSPLKLADDGEYLAYCVDTFFEFFLEKRTTSSVDYDVDYCRYDEIN